MFRLYIIQDVFRRFIVLFNKCRVDINVDCEFCRMPRVASAKCLPSIEQPFNCLLCGDKPSLRLSLSAVKEMIQTQQKATSGANSHLLLIP